MIKGIGCDIVNHELTHFLDWESDELVLQRCFSATEINQYRSNPSVKFLSGRFAAKEAVLKCLGVGMEDGISLLEIEIYTGSLGQPEIVLSGKVKLISNKLGIDRFYLSISHTTAYSIAMVIAQGLEN